MTNIEIATLISERIGTAPVPFESVRGLALEIYQELGGTESDENFEDIYEILVAILSLAENATYFAGQNISINASNYISADGYIFDSSNGSFATIYRQDSEDGGALVANSATGLGAVAEGYNTISSGGYGSHAEGYITNASGPASHTEGGATSATGTGAHAEGYGSTATAQSAHAEGGSTIASGKNSHSEGGKLKGKNPTTASGNQSHAEGGITLASGQSAHAEGEETIASGSGSHAEGVLSVASGICAHAEGRAVDGQYTHAEGESSHAEGWSSHAEGSGSHSEGRVTHAKGEASHAEGEYTFAQNLAEHAEGMYNLSHKSTNIYGDAGNTQHSIGINNKNAQEIMQNGDMYILGIGGYQGTDTKVQNASIMTIQQYISSLEARIYALEHPNS